MARRSRQNPLVREFILRNVESQPRSISSSTGEEFSLTRQAVNRYINRLIDEGYLEATGKTNARRYSLKNIVTETFVIEEITRTSSENAIWRYRVFPFLRDVPQNVINICQYGFTEIFNNVIDHSLSDRAIVSYEQTYTGIKMIIIDSGVGIFQKIQNDFDLPDSRTALLELSKGKLTSDKKRHSGEGIFFTSRMFDQFTIRSRDLFYIKTRDGDEWMIETGEMENILKGTSIQMNISTNTKRTTRQIFDEFQGDNIRFRKTHVPVLLGKYPGEQLVSRSQAKRILTRFDQFSEAILDFSGVEDIGQPFADEIFRVFRMDHPDIKIYGVNMNENVEKMMQYVMNSSNET